MFHNLNWSATHSALHVVLNHCSTRSADEGSSLRATDEALVSDISFPIRTSPACVTCLFLPIWMVGVGVQSSEPPLSLTHNLI